VSVISAASAAVPVAQMRRFRCMRIPPASHAKEAPPPARRAAPGASALAGPQFAGSRTRAFRMRPPRAACPAAWIRPCTVNRS
jgi:hypothetical protein